MDGDWLTYREAAERLGSTAAAVRYRALRGKWPRRRGNDGRARVQLPDEPNPVRTPSAQPVRTPSEPRADPALLHALEGHIDTLKADIETLKGQLAAAEARAEKQGEEAAERDARHVPELEAERAKVEAERTKAEKALAEFAALAKRLAALAERSRPWWRRFVG